MSETIAESGSLIISQHSSLVSRFYHSSTISTLTRFSKLSLTLGFTLASAGLLALYKFQDKIVYPSSLNGGRGMVDTPDMYGMSDYENVDLSTKDGETLKAFSILHDPDSPDYKNKTILVLCPNAGNMGHFLPVARLFYQEMGYNVFIYSYRGYGKSTGKASEVGLKIDADTVIDYINSHKQLSSSSLILYGRSLGGAVAIYMASHYPSTVSGMILENTFLSIRKVIPHIFPLIRYFASLCHQIWNSEEEIAGIPSHIPVMFLSGLCDEVVPPEHMKSLYDMSKASYKEWHEFPGAMHNDTISQPNYFTYFYKFASTKVNPIDQR